MAGFSSLAGRRVKGAVGVELRMDAEAPPLGRLLYLYVGSSDVAKDLGYYRDTLGAAVAWDSTAFGTRVAAVRVGEGPLLLLAGHRAPRSVIQVYQVPRLRGAAASLRKRGWKPKGDAFGVPDGPCFLFEDPTGNELAILEVSRPDAMLKG